MNKKEIKRRKNAKLAAEIDKRIAVERSCAFQAGREAGRCEAHKEQAENLFNAECKANIQYAEALGKLTDAVCQAACAFFGEGGLHRTKPS